MNLAAAQQTGSVLTFAWFCCQQILRDTGVFEHTWKELELWLEHLDSTAEEHREAVIQFLERVSAWGPLTQPVPDAADPERTRC